jgi:ABC-2 type transport system ATP-binding protein
MREVERLADRVGLLADGALVAVGRPRALIDEHGGDSRLVVRLRDPATARRAAGGVDGFAPSADGDRLVFEGVSPVEIGDAVAALDAAGVDYESLAWREPGLEEVFLRLTGEAFAGTGGTAAGDGPGMGPGARRSVGAGAGLDGGDDAGPSGTATGARAGTGTGTGTERGTRRGGDGA